MQDLQSSVAGDESNLEQLMVCVVQLRCWIWVFSAGARGGGFQTRVTSKVTRFLNGEQVCCDSGYCHRFFSFYFSDLTKDAV